MQEAHLDESLRIVNLSLTLCQKLGQKDADVFRVDLLRRVARCQLDLVTCTAE